MAATPPPEPIDLHHSVPLGPGICPPEARYPISLAARIANDNPADCTPIDPCGLDGTTLWTAQPCTPDLVDQVVAPPPAPAPPQQLPATGLTALDATILTIACVTVAAGVALRRLARTMHRQGSEGS